MLLRRRVTAGTAGGWADLPEELVAKVLEMLDETRSRVNPPGLGFSESTATVRLVCAAWKAVYDSLATRLVLSWRTTDVGMGMLVRRFPAVVSIEFKGDYFTLLTDKGLRAVISLHALTFLNLSACRNVTAEGLRAVSNCTALTSLDLTFCGKVTDEALRAVSNLPALTSLNLTDCRNVTAEGLRAVSNLRALTSLNLNWCIKVNDAGLRAVSKCTALTSLELDGCYEVTDVGVRAVSKLPALSYLDLYRCPKVTAACVQALRSTATPSIQIQWSPPEESEGSEEGSEDSDYRTPN